MPEPASAAVARPAARPPPDPDALLQSLVTPARRDRLQHVEHVPARPGEAVDWPSWAHPQVVSALRSAGVERPWRHQVAAADLAANGQSVVLATGTASGKSLAYLLPALSATLEARELSLVQPAGGAAEQGAVRTRHRSATALSRLPTTLYLAPTKALAADQLRALRALDLPDIHPATFDGDTSFEERDWVRRYSSYVLTNPDMLHRSILPGHARWAAYLRSLQFVVIDECHHYRGIFGSHVANIVRRLRRICQRYGSNPTFILASATVSEPATSASRLVGAPVVAVDEDTSPRGATVFGLWEPPLTELRGENGAPVRRTATAEVGDLLADLVVEGVRTVAFVRSRRGAESVSATTRRLLDEVEPRLAAQVCAYRGGYLPEERREVERALQDGTLLGVAATNALELGVDIAGLDAVLLAGYPGTRASLWQQAGRAGRAGQGALAVLVARDDPLDTYLTHHPEMLFGQPVETTVLDPGNPHVLAPHLCAAAAEAPLTDDDLVRFGPAARHVVDHLAHRQILRRRPDGWYWTSPGRASDLADIRGAGGEPIRLAELATGRLLGTVDAASAHATVHEGAVYLHQGATYVVHTLDLTERVAMLEPAEPDYSTFARDITDIRIVDTETEQHWGDVGLCFGTVQVTNQVVSYLRKRVITGEVLGEVPLELPVRELRTRAVWWTVPADVLAEAELDFVDVPGAAHAAEHAAIGLLPLFATCDRWDIGGVSTARHEDTGTATIFVYDGHPGGAGFAERGFRAAAPWLTATHDAVRACECATGCPSCVQSPKCGNGNDPLDKGGAVRLLAALLRRTTA